MPPTDTIWPLEPHSVGKHKVLKSYLNAWLPKLGRWNGRITFIDGFCGPGEYLQGEPGSPIVALDAYLNHASRDLLHAEVGFLFGDADEARLKYLDTLIQKRAPLPAKCKVRLSQGDFNERMSALLDKLEQDNQRMAPAFVMLDPFGVSDTPHRLVRRILQHPKSEVYISFMYEHLNRFKLTKEFGSHLDELFGTEEWREGSSINDPAERKSFFYDLYERQLRAAGAKHVVRFELFEGNRLVYAIFFATQNWHGADVMKQAIWRLDPLGDFRFVGSRTGTLFDSITQFDTRPLHAILKKRFGSDAWTTIDDIEAFVGSSETDYHTGQLKKPLLRPLEDTGLLEVDPTSRNRRGTYPSGTRLRFR